MMIFAEGTIDSDLFTYQDALILVLVVGGALFLLTSVVLGQGSISSGPSRRTRFVAKDDPFGAAGPAERSQATKDKRRSPRRRGNPTPVLISDGLATGEPVQGMVLNRSRGGLYLSIPRSVEVGQALSVRTDTFPQDLASVQLRVRHCQQQGDRWRVGCQFVEELPWSIILMFG